VPKIKTKSNQCQVHFTLKLLVHWALTFSRAQVEIHHHFFSFIVWLVPVDMWCHLYHMSPFSRLRAGCLSCSGPLALHSSDSWGEQCSFSKFTWHLHIFFFHIHFEEHANSSSPPTGSLSGVLLNLQIWKILDVFLMLNCPIQEKWNVCVSK
jgi:hypothetical protein